MDYYYPLGLAIHPCLAHGMRTPAVVLSIRPVAPAWSDGLLMSNPGPLLRESPSSDHPLRACFVLLLIWGGNPEFRRSLTHTYPGHDRYPAP